MTPQGKVTHTAALATLVLSEECVFEQGSKRLLKRRTYTYDPALGEPGEDPEANAIAIVYSGWSHFGHQFETQLSTFALTQINTIALATLIDQFCQGIIAYIGQEDICTCLLRMSWAGDAGYLCPGNF